MGEAKRNYKGGERLSRRTRGKFNLRIAMLSKWRTLGGNHEYRGRKFAKDSTGASICVGVVPFRSRRPQLTGKPWTRRRR